MSSKSIPDNKPHVVCIPAPYQSHVKAMLKLAKLLHHKGFQITFINTESNHKLFLKTGGSNSLDGLSDFRFETIPDGLDDSNQDINDLTRSIQNYMFSPFCDMLAKSKDPTVPPVSCIVSDGYMPFTTTAAELLGIPIILFYPVAACAFMGGYQSRSLLEKGFTPLNDSSNLTNGNLDTIIDWIPGMKPLRLKDLPGFVRTTDTNGSMFNFAMEGVEGASKASGVIIHTFDALERDVLDALSQIFPFLLTIGPLDLLLKNQISDDEENLKFIGFNPWKENIECIKWLDSKQPNSVIYVNFGSIAVVTNQQLVEFGWGLANSKHYFLWIIRPDLVIGDSAILPKEFMVEIKERGLIVNWCPQEQVLNHPSVGGFLTHNGWNSTIESLSAGVPMICWPFLGDQQTNCKYSCNEWEIGMEIDGDVRRNEVERVIRELMNGERGKKMKKKGEEWKKLAEKATGPYGSSSLNLDKLVNKILSRS